MRRDLKTIIEWVRPLTAILTLSTNGTLIDDEYSTWFPGSYRWSQSEPGRRQQGGL